MKERAFILANIRDRVRVPNLAKVRGWTRVSSIAKVRAKARVLAMAKGRTRVLTITETVVGVRVPTGKRNEGWSKSSEQTRNPGQRKIHGQE